MAAFAMMMFWTTLITVGLILLLNKLIPRIFGDD